MGKILTHFPELQKRYKFVLFLCRVYVGIKASKPLSLERLRSTTSTRIPADTRISVAVGIQLAAGLGMCIVGKIIKNVGSAHHSAHQKKWAYYVGIRRNVYQNMH